MYKQKNIFLISTKTFQLALLEKEQSFYKFFMNHKTPNDLWKTLVADNPNITDSDLKLTHGCLLKIETKIDSEMFSGKLRIEAKQNLLELCNRDQDFQLRERINKNLTAVREGTLGHNFEEFNAKLKD
jgi:hypothetical protein